MVFHAGVIQLLGFFFNRDAVLNQLRRFSHGVDQTLPN